MMYFIIVNEIIYLGFLIGVLFVGFIGFLLWLIGKCFFYLVKFFFIVSIIGGLFFIFGIYYINWEIGIINGYFYEESGWI